MASPPISPRRGSSFFAPAASLTTRRLRSNSGGIVYDDDVATLTDAEKNSIVPPAPVYKIVLTGGPCGGKTTLLARLSPYLRERGFEVMTCPEAFTMLITNGFAFDYLGAVDGMPIVVQDTVLEMQISLEDSLERVLRARGKPAVILCDRGLMDGKAYMDEESWQKILDKRECTCESQLREGRYNAVYHLVTAAEGAEQFYTLENNQARTETPELAREMDHKTRNAWVGHPNLKIFDNSTDFERKLQRVVEETAKLVGLPTQMQKVTIKFLLKEAPDLSQFPEDVTYQIFDVEKVYLYEEDVEKENAYSFVRKRTTINKDGTVAGSVFGWTSVQKTADGQTIERKRIISMREYNSLFKNRDKLRHVVKQKRISFLWNIQSFTIHQYVEPAAGLTILHAQVRSSGSGSESGSEGRVEIPPFLEVEKELATDSGDDALYGAYRLSIVK